jgi:hypothetical protein
MQMFTTTRNVVLQNGGTFTDAGFRLDVNGTARVQGALTTTGNITIPNASYYQSLTSTATTVRMLGINSGNVAYVGAIDAGAVSTIFNASSTSLTASFYTSGTEKLTINSIGSVGIGSTSLTGYTLRASKNLTGGTTSYGIAQSGTVQSDVTSVLYSYFSQINTAAASFTLGYYIHYMADNAVSLGAGSVVTNQVGFFAQSSLTSATNNYGFYGNIASGTNRWNLYMNGTANNYMAGRLGIGITNAAYDLDVFSGTANVTIAANTNNNGFSGIVSTYNSAYGNFIHMRSYGNTTASTIFGISTNGMNALWSNNDTIYAIGTIGATAMVFGTNNTERVRVKSTGQMRFVPLASDPSGAQSGDVYYNSTISALKLYDGTVWRTITVI